MEMEPPPTLTGFLIGTAREVVGEVPAAYFLQFFSGDMDTLQFFFSFRKFCNGEK
jgi:hypothetical protein